MLFKLSMLMWGCCCRALTWGVSQASYLEAAGAGGEVLSCQLNFSVGRRARDWHVLRLLSAVWHCGAVQVLSHSCLSPSMALAGVSRRL